RMGLIASGARGYPMMVRTSEIDSAVRFIALSDAYQPRRNRGVQVLGDQGKQFQDHRKLLEMKEIDAVVIASPELLHGSQLLDAVSAGKDVYVEKPMAYSSEEGVRIIEAVRKSDRVVQVGMQRR